MTIWGAGLSQNSGQRGRFDHRSAPIHDLADSVTDAHPQLSINDQLPVGGRPLSARRQGLSGVSLGQIGLGNQTLVHITRVIVGGPRVGLLRRSDRRRLLRPALVDGSETPLGAPARGANRLAVD